MLNIRKGDDHDLANAAGIDLENIPGGHDETAAEHEAEQKQLERASKISKAMALGLVSKLHVGRPVWYSQLTQTLMTDHCLPRPLAHANVRFWLHL